MFKSVNHTPDDQVGNVVSVQMTEGTSVPLVWPTLFAGHAISNQINSLAGSVATVASTMVAVAPDLSEAGYRERTLKELERVIVPDWRNAQKHIVSSKVDLATRKAKAVSTDGFDKSLWPVHISALLKLSVSKRINLLLQSDDPALLAAAVQAGSELLEIIPSVWTQVLRHFAIVKHLKGPGSQFTPQAPSINNLCPSEPDWVVLREHAEDSYNEMQNADEALIAAERYIGQIIPFVANSAANLSNAEIYKILAG